MVRHFVHLRFQPSCNQAQRDELFAALANLQNHIDGILDFQVRRNISVEQAVVRGFDDMFWFDFRDQSVRDNYLQDPQHQAVGKRLVSHLQGGEESVFVCDVEV